MKLNFDPHSPLPRRRCNDGSQGRSPVRQHATHFGVVGGSAGASKDLSGSRNSFDMGEIQGYFIGSLKQALLSIMIGMMIPLMINILGMGWNWKSSATHFKTPLCNVCLSSDVLQA